MIFQKEILFIFTSKIYYEIQKYNKKVNAGKYNILYIYF